MRSHELAWYWGRLSRMSPPELAYRVAEQARRWRDSRARFGWDRFASPDALEVHGLPGLERDGAARLAADAAAYARAVLDGRLAFLGQDWPPLGPRWWRGDAWRIDPATRRLWPGGERFAFDVSYRHEADAGDVKFVWELNRLQMLPPLAIHARLSGDAAAANAVWEIVDGWMAANPPFRGINWSSGIELASRLVSVLAALAFSPPPPEMQPRLIAFVNAHAFWLQRYPSLHSSANNHRVAELAGLFLAGLCAPGLPQAGAWREAGRAGLEGQALRQFHADGVGVEQSPTYAAYSLEWFALAAAAARAGGAPFSAAYDARLGQAAEFLAWMLDGAGAAPGRRRRRRWAGADGAAGARAALCRVGRGHGAAWARPAGHPRRASRSLSCATSWAPGPRRTRLRPRVRAPSRRAATRCCGGRRSEGPVLAAFDHGPLGFLAIAAHGHADALSLWLHWGEEAVIVDAGTYLYHSGGQVRDLFRGTPVHNTLAVEGADQSRIAGPFNWSRHARTRLLQSGQDAVAAEHDGYRDAFGLTHRRELRFEERAVVVTDRLGGAPRGGRAAWALGYTLNPACAVEGRRRHGPRDHAAGACPRVRKPRRRRLAPGRGALFARVQRAAGCAAAGAARRAHHRLRTPGGQDADHLGAGLSGATVVTRRLAMIASLAALKVQRLHSAVVANSAAMRP